MRLSNPAKSVLLLFVPVLLFCGCSSNGSANATTVPFVSEHASTLPFSTTEPERYQADIIVRSGAIERKYFVARDGERRRTDYDVEQHGHRVRLTSGREYVIDFDRKIFAVVPRTAAGREADEESTLHFLNQRHDTAYTEIGTEDGLTKYRAEIDGFGGSEIILHIDRATNLPIKQEYFSIEGDRREMVYSVEMQNVRTEIDLTVFEIPTGFREVPFTEFRRKPRK